MLSNRREKGTNLVFGMNLLSKEHIVIQDKKSFSGLKIHFLYVSNEYFFSKFPHLPAK